MTAVEIIAAGATILFYVLMVCSFSVGIMLIGALLGDEEKPPRRWRSLFSLGVFIGLGLFAFGWFAGGGAL